jgi:hypothetical protein
MDKESQQNAVDSLRDWSKWLIGIDFAAATGCVVVLQGGVEGPPRPFLILAICAFALSVLCSVLLVRVLASIVEQLPLVGDDGKPISIYDHLACWNITIAHLAHIQLILLVLGGIFFLTWVYLKPAP